MTAFDTAFATTVGIEGGYSIVRSDPGNWTGGAVGVGQLRGTRYGISAASYPTLDIKNLTLDAAKAIYRTQFWDRIAGDELPAPIAIVVFDCAVNQGITVAKEILQAALGVSTDGVIGTGTIDAAQQHENVPDQVVLEIGARRCLRYAQTNSIATFGLGWMRRVFTTTAAAIPWDTQRPACGPPIAIPAPLTPVH